MTDGRYVLLAELRSRAQATATQDGELTTALLSAEESIDAHCRRRFDAVDLLAEPTERFYTEAGDARIRVDDVVQVEAIDTRLGAGDNWTAVDLAKLELAPLNAAADGRPYTSLSVGRALSGIVRVTGWFGWPETPAVVKQATLTQAVRLFNRRNAAFGVAPVPGLEGSGGMRLLAKLDADVELLLQGVRRRPVLVG